MKKIFLSLVAASATCMIATGAQAASSLTISGPSGVFVNDDVICSAGVVGPCGFTNTFTFVTPTAFNSASLDISSIATANPLTDINFSSVTFNGVAFTTLATGVSEFRTLLTQVLTPGATNTLTIEGTTGGNAAYSGNVSFASAGVPEPATWGLMLLGFSSLGFVMRRRPTSTGRVRFA